MVNMPRNLNINLTTPHWLNQFLDVPMAAPDARRRGRLLNILLMGIALTGFVTILATAVIQITTSFTQQEANTTYIASAALIGGIITIYIINRYWSGNLASTLFLLLVIGILYSSDTPYESIWGRNMITLAIPIVMASVILPPTTSFVMAGVISIAALIIASFESFDPNIIGVITYFAFAFVSWLSARSMDRAVQELRQTNQELDQRVAQRTAELRDTNVQLEHEIEARKQVNAELVVARDRALEVSRLKSQLLANVSHELRTPLGAILGFAEMLRVGFYGPINEQQRSTINKIIETNQDLTNHVSELLDQAQLEAGKLKLNNQVFEPGELLLDVVNILGILTKEKGVDLTHTIDPNLPITLIGDPVRLQQILMNLIGNAIKFTDLGTVTASVYRVDEDEWAMAVQDTGPGIPREAQEYIFEPFRQVDGTITRIHEGTGLGLSIVKQLVNLMNGRVTIKSEPGKGSLLTVILPIIMPDEEKDL